MLAYITRETYFIMFILWFETLPKLIGFSTKAPQQERKCCHVVLAEGYCQVFEMGFILFSVVCWKVKSNLLLDSTCDGINPDYCFPSDGNVRVHQKASHQRRFISNLGLVGEGKGGWTVSQTSEWKMSSVTLVSAGRSLADVALQEWRFQSPMKWNYGALHGSLAFERFQRYALNGKRLRQLENDTAPQTIDTKKLQRGPFNHRFSVCCPYHKTRPVSLFSFYFNAFFSLLPKLQ